MSFLSKGTQIIKVEYRGYIFCRLKCFVLKSWTANYFLFSVILLEVAFPMKSAGFIQYYTVQYFFLFFFNFFNFFYYYFFYIALFLSLFNSALHLLL